MEPIELCNGWRRKVPALALATITLLVAVGAAYYYNQTQTAKILGVLMMFTAAALVTIEFLHALPRKWKQELSLIFFRTLGHKYDQSVIYVRNGCEQQCLRCGEWRHSLSIEPHGEATRVEWRYGRYPRVLEVIDQVPAPQSISRGRWMAVATLLGAVCCIITADWIAAGFALALAFNYSTEFEDE